MHLRRLVVGGLAVTFALITTGFTPAAARTADDLLSPSANEISATANRAGGVPGVAIARKRSSGRTAFAGADATISQDPDSGFSLESRDGSTVLIGIPGAGSDDGVVAGGNVVYPDAVAETSVVARPTDQGAQALVVIHGPAAPTEFAFPIEVEGEGAGLRSGRGGTVEVVDRSGGAVVAVVMPAWATDRNGASVPTHFEIRGSNLVQVVDHQGSAYPVIADPNTCGIVTCTYYFGKRATKDFTGASSFVGVCGAVGAALPVAGWWVAAVCITYAAAIITQANRARNRGMCLKIKYSRVPPPAFAMYPGIYSGKHCR